MEKGENVSLKRFLRNLANMSNRSSPLPSRLTSSQPHLNLLKTEENLRSRSAVQGNSFELNNFYLKILQILNTQNLNVFDALEQQSKIELYLATIITDMKIGSMENLNHSTESIPTKNTNRKKVDFL